MKFLDVLRKKKVAVSVGSASIASCVLAVSASADAVTPTATTDYQTIIGQVTAVMSNANITSVLQFAIGAAVVMVFTWWAARKVAGIIKRAFMRGKLKF